MIKLCGFHISNYFCKAHIAMLEKGVSFELDPTCKPSQKEDFLARTPMGRWGELEELTGAIVNDGAFDLSGGIIGATTLLATNYFVVRFIFKHRRLDQLIEGSPTTLVENGKVVKAGLAKELLTEAELTTVAHRQGFSCIDEIEHCILEPGGNFYVKGKVPGDEVIRHNELLKKLDDLAREITMLKASTK